MQTLLTQTARLTDVDPQLFADALARITDWGELSKQAEAQSLAPLLYHHLQRQQSELKNQQIEIPRSVKRELSALYLRHKHAHQVHTETLSEILAAYRTVNIETIVLKGAALAFLVYPTPNLRPKRDIDLLVKPEDAIPAQKILRELGFKAPLPRGADLPDKHLDAATRKQKGMVSSIEIHHNLFNVYHPVSMTFADFTSAPLPFAVDEQTTAYSLGYEDMLWHLCQHVAYHANVWEPIRLIWVADIIGFAERFSAQIDWGKMANQYPLVLNMLSLFHFITPLSDNLRRLAPVKIGQCPAGIGEEFRGWPRSSLDHQQTKGYQQILIDTFFPSEWWLRLHYGLNSAESLIWYRGVRHPIHILARIRQFIQDNR
ncbi:nucleotidyltransferase family protein [Anaerolineales bacterium HSG6]|nr:nucleotidyltransferase family protein [Anaerolineales bacterium HSG6]MDM8531729.1 nucleotidyltransferase family protein [Anaerolineales bacterium HSG25]